MGDNDWVREHNANYLGLTLKQYDRFLVYANAKIVDWPAALREYVKYNPGYGPTSGDDLFCRIADWVKSGEVGIADA